ncbi:MAG TPA: S8 family peptidase [Longimicrobium sp.]|nr:S8 family peptidase [Longimicrobium sp.]
MLVPIARLSRAACSDVLQPPAPAASEPAARSAPGSPDHARYIVVLKERTGATPASTRIRAAAVADEAGADPSHLYAGVLQGFAAELTPAQVAALQRRGDVAYVEPDTEARLFTTQSPVYSWGIDRVDDYNLPLDGSYTYTRTGAGVTAYILDSGINLNHLDVVGRAAYIANGSNGDFVGDGHGSAADCHGHGSHVAGTVGGTYSGIAKQVTIRAGRVVNCTGGGTASMAIAAMDWIRLNGSKPAVVNMSLGYGNNASVRAAAENLVAAGFTVVAAAGNGDYLGNPLDACNESPAGAPNVITVGATDNTDHEASFSNYGTCVDILAPGVGIMSSDYLVTNQVNSRSGTSMATPHVAGVAALVLQANPTGSPALVWRHIFGNAFTGTITRNRVSIYYGTPNRFLFTDW